MGVSLEEMKARLVRYRDLVPCKTAFIDTRTPGSDKKENFTIIGPGVSESPGQHVHVAIPHGFNIGGARQPKGTVNSQHSHETEEVFLVHSGEWAFRTGVNADDGEVILRAGDVISIPTNVFRGFECLSDGDSFLFAILGGDDPGHVTWAPYVFEQAKDHGLVLTESGRLIDTAAGESIPEDETICQPVGEDELDRFDTVDSETLEKFVIRADDMGESHPSLLSGMAPGISEAPLLGKANAEEGIGEGVIPTDHGFHFRLVELASNSLVPAHSRDEEEVIFVHSGAIAISWEDETLTLGEGDTLTVPKGLVRAWSNPSDDTASVFVVRGGDAPTGPSWCDGTGREHQAA
ncbi:MAG: cupin domain-containing protein [Erythrobacter sp.]|uniref:cupin domain-containing protein n=1 Tax=Erythrobacter sp. TaxID=1042 RepID=UPI003A841FBA